jgi:hypothetical protein
MERPFFCQSSERHNLGRFQCTHNAICDDRRFVQPVLPNAYNLPTLSAQLATHSPVAFPVIADFAIPKLLIAARTFIALWAAVPKATVHKNDNALKSKGEIRFAEKRLVASPAGNMELAKNLNQAQL